MDMRIQRYLDGELAREDLTPEEERQATEVETLLRQVVASVPAQPLPDLSKAILDRLPHAEEETVVERESPLDIIRGAVSWIWSPRPISLQWRPAYAFALVALIAGAVIARQQTEAPLQVTGAEPAARVFVQFRLDAPNAREVALAGDFTAWKPALQLTRTDAGTWTIVVPVTPGVHDYAFIVDGETWVADPMAPAVEDGFGGHNSRLAVLTPDVRAL